MSNYNDSDLPTFDDNNTVAVEHFKPVNNLDVIIKSEIDIQISTAKAYPRSLKAFKSKALSMATLDMQTAEMCFYTLPRGGKTIEGPSVRLAEIVLASWQNIRAAARIIGNDRKTITAQAICHDLENNVSITIEVKRRITDKNGRTYNEDMQVVTGNAACAIALRNSIFKVIPMAYTKELYDQIKKVAAGDVATLEERRIKALKHFKDMGVGYDRIYAVLGVQSDVDIDQDGLLKLIGLANALRDGDTTLEEAFPKLTAEKTETQVKSETALKDTMNKINEVKNGGAVNPGKAYRSHRG
jgi:hypothetical protein